MDVNKALLEKYYKGHCNEAEQRAIEEWLMKPDGFTGDIVASDSAARHRMWQVIRPMTIGKTGGKARRYVAVIASIALLFATGFHIWGRFNRLPAPGSYVVIDNTRNHLLSKRNVGDILLSESANSGWKHVSRSGNKSCLVYTNSLIINNQKGENIWVYLKISSESGSRMIKFLCKGKKTYVAGFITEYTEKGNRKYLYSRQASVPEDVAGSMNSQLNAARVNAKLKGDATIII